jgi:hypothetical protein
MHVYSEIFMSTVLRSLLLLLPLLAALGCGGGTEEKKVDQATIEQEAKKLQEMAAQERGGK